MIIHRKTKVRLAATLIITSVILILVTLGILTTGEQESNSGGGLFSTVGADGSYNFTFPFIIPSGTHGVQPQLSLGEEKVPFNQRQIRLFLFR